MFACTRKERQISRAGTPYLTVELRDSTARSSARAFRDADVLAGRFERGELVRVRGRVERFRDELQIEVATIARAEGDGGRPGALPAGRLPRPRRARGLPRAPRARGLRPGAASAARRRCSATATLRARDAPRALLAAAPAPARAPGARRSALTTPTSAACSSTPSRSRRWRSSCARCTRAWIAICCCARRSCTTSARRASSPTAPRSRAARRGGCSATSSSACA